MVFVEEMIMKKELSIFKALPALVPFLIAVFGAISIISCSKASTETEESSYAFCIFVTERLCTQGPYTSCPAGGILTNDCPYDNIPQSSSSAGTTQSSSSSEATQSSSSSAEATQSSSSAEATQSSSSSAEATQSSSSSAEATQSSSSSIIAVGGDVIWNLSINTTGWTNYHNSTSTVGFYDNAIGDYVNISEEGPVTGISNWNGNIKISLSNEPGTGYWGGVSFSYPENTAQNYPGICIEYATALTFRLRLGGTRTCSVGGCEPYYRTLLNQSTITKTFFDFRDFNDYGNFDHNVDLAKSSSIIFHRGNDFSGATVGPSYLYIRSIKFGLCSED